MGPTLCLWRLIVFRRRTLAVAHFLDAITDATGDEGTQAAVDGNAGCGLHAGLREEHMGRGDEADCEGELQNIFHENVLFKLLLDETGLERGLLSVSVLEVQQVAAGGDGGQTFLPLPTAI